MQELNRLLNGIAFLRKELNKDLPSQHIALLLTVAGQPGIPMPGLSQELDMPQGTVSRNVKLLSHYVEKNGTVSRRKGYGLLRTEPSATNRYQLSVYLTEKGEDLMRNLVEVMEQGADTSVHEKLQSEKLSASSG